jgi:hypothetical protein
VRWDDTEVRRGGTQWRLNSVCNLRSVCEDDGWMEQGEDTKVDEMSDTKTRPDVSTRSTGGEDSTK